MSDPIAFQKTLHFAACTAVDSMHALQCVQYALLAVEELLDPEVSNASKVTQVERLYLHALIASLNTRLWHELEAANVAVKNVADLAHERQL